MKNEENQMDIELSEEIALGIYSNLAIITHSPAEVVCDFVQIMPGMPKGKVRSAQYCANISAAKQGDKNPMFGKKIVFSDKSVGKITELKIVSKLFNKLTISPLFCSLKNFRKGKNKLFNIFVFVKNSPKNSQFDNNNLYVNALL
jgi:hypothetical protein